MGSCTVDSLARIEIELKKTLEFIEFANSVSCFLFLQSKITMAVEADRLVEIPSKDLSTLRNLYKSPENGSRTHIAYESIDVYIRWLEQDPNANMYIKFYCLNGDFSDGTFIVIVSIRFVVKKRAERAKKIRTFICFFFLLLVCYTFE